LNRPLEDLDPFMSREELEREMVVKMVWNGKDILKKKK
jgi:hypothetical protein